MSENSYEKGRLNLPFVGFCTFAKSPIAEDWDNIKADVAFMGAPYDCGTQWRSGAVSYTHLTLPTTPYV